MKTSFTAKLITHFIKPACLLNFTLLVGLSSHSIAEDHGDFAEFETDEISELSLDQLLNLDVSVASSSPEAIPRTPAIVSRYEADDFKNMGLHSLEDFLSFIPGVVIQSSYVSKVVSIRGIFEGLNQKVLFLLDGVPYFMTTNSEIPLLGIPFEAISHVEIIRGPGAVYHGTNASAGVINVVTRTSAQSRVAVTTGSNKLTNASGYISETLENDIHLSVAYEVQAYDGYQGQTRGAQSNPFSGNMAIAGDVPRGEEMRSVLAQVSHNDLHVSLQAYNSQNKALGGFLATDSATINDTTGMMIHVENTWHLGDTTVFTYLDHNPFYWDFLVENQAPVFGDDGMGGSTIVGAQNGGFRMPQHAKNYRTRGGITVNKSLTDTIELFALAESERRSNSDYESFNSETNQSLLTIIEPGQVNENSLALQLDMRFDALRLLVGGRYVNNSLAGGKFNPRISLLYDIDDHQSVKLLYATGFNSPNTIQQTVNAPNLLVGNDDLSAESVTTWDLVYSYYKDDFLASINIYHFTAEDFIERELVPAPGRGSTYANTGDFDRNGIEIDFQYALHNAKVFSNLSYQDEGDTVIEGDIAAQFVQQLTFSAGGFYKLDDRHMLGGSLRTVSKRNDANEYYHLNLHYRYALNRFEAFVTIDNVLDQHIEHPDVVNFRPAAYLDSADGRTFLFGLSTRF